MLRGRSAKVGRGRTTLDHRRGSGVARGNGRCGGVTFNRSVVFIEGWALNIENTEYLLDL